MNDTASRPHEGLPCPVCRVDLVMSDRQGIEIDYCPKCRGVWLDRGELDKIIERSAAETSQVSQQRSSAPPSSSEAPSAPGPWGGYDQHGGHGGHGHVMATAAAVVTDAASSVGYSTDANNNKSNEQTIRCLGWPQLGNSP